MRVTINSHITWFKSSDKTDLNALLCKISDGVLMTLHTVGSETDHETTSASSILAGGSTNTMFFKIFCKSSGNDSHERKAGRNFWDLEASFWKPYCTKFIPKMLSNKEPFNDWYKWSNQMLKPLHQGMRVFEDDNSRLGHRFWSMLQTCVTPCCFMISSHP